MRLCYWVLRSKHLINCLDELINPFEDFKSYLELAENKNLTFIFSNTTEAGISHDRNDNFNNKPPASFPAKLFDKLTKVYRERRGSIILHVINKHNRNHNPHPASRKAVSSHKVGQSSRSQRLARDNHARKAATRAGVARECNFGYIFIRKVWRQKTDPAPRNKSLKIWKNRPGRVFTRFFSRGQVRISQVGHPAGQFGAWPGWALSTLCQGTTREFTGSSQFRWGT